MNSRLIRYIFLLIPLLIISGCGEDESKSIEEKVEPKVSAVRIATHPVEQKNLQIWLESSGRARSKVAPTLATEIDGRIVSVEVGTGDSVEKGKLLAEMDTSALVLEIRASEADIKRLETQVSNERRRLKRYSDLDKKNLVSKTQLDDTLAQLDVFIAELEAARARQAIISDRIAKASVVAPVTGEIQKRYISSGDYVKTGDPLFEIVEQSRLQVWLPFPETQSLQIRRGLKVVMQSPVAPEVKVEGEITDIQPSIGNGSRAIVAIVEVDNPGSWLPEATVVGRVLVETRQQVYMVPEISVVRRPVGEVVYVIEAEKAHTRTVLLGERSDGMVEVTQGLTGSELLATDGAAFLVDGTAVQVVEKQP